MMGLPMLDRARPEPHSDQDGSTREGLASVGPFRVHFPEALLAAAILLGLVRFVRLGASSLWFDEVLTWGDAHASGAGPSNRLGYLIVRWTVELLGHGPTEGALRFAPALAGWLAIPLTAWALSLIHI